MQGFGFKPVSNPSEMTWDHFNCLTGAVHHFVGGKYCLKHVQLYVIGSQYIYLSQSRSVGKYVTE